jgi:hypothetical protein
MRSYEFDFHLSYIKAKRIWRQRIFENNIKTGKLLDSYFEEISKIIGPEGLIVKP